MDELRRGAKTPPRIPIVSRRRAKGQSSAAVALESHRCGEPPRAHAPCDGRVTGSGRSPGSRVVVFVRLPGNVPSGMMDQDSPLTVAGAASVWLKRRGRERSRRIGGTEFPIGRFLGRHLCRNPRTQAGRKRFVNGARDTAGMKSRRDRAAGKDRGAPGSRHAKIGEGPVRGTRGLDACRREKIAGGTMTLHRRNSPERRTRTDPCRGIRSRQSPGSARRDQYFATTGPPNR